MQIKMMISRLRADSGNMMMLTLLVMTIALMVCASFMTIYSVIAARQKLEERTENLCMVAARSLNTDDHAGQMNNLTAASRELVFNSRNTYDYVANNNKFYLALASKLLDQSREGAEALAQERARLIKFTLSDISNLIIQVNKHDNNLGRFIVPWVLTGEVSIVNADLGFIKGVPSNVGAPVNNLELSDLDKSLKYVDPTTNLYYGNLSLNLL